MNYLKNIQKEFVPAYLSIFFLFLSLFGLFLSIPYFFYQLLRIIICISSIYYAIIYKKNTFLMYGFICTAIIFNFISPLYLPKHLWLFVDFITLIFFASFIFKFETISNIIMMKLDKGTLETIAIIGLLVIVAIVSEGSENSFIFILIYCGLWFLLTKLYNALLDVKLKEAICDGNIKRVKHYISQKHFINEKNSSGETALIIASCNGQLEVVKYLLGLDFSINHINERNHLSETALMKASENGHLEVVKYLVSQKAAISVKDISGETALTKAIIKNHLEIIKYLESQVIVE